MNTIFPLQSRIFPEILEEMENTNQTPVNSFQEQQQKQTPFQPATLKKRNWRKWILILVGIVVIGIVALTLYLFYSIYSVQDKLLPGQKQVIPITISPVVNPIANWKTYTNNNLRFSFQYPPKGRIRQLPNGIWLQLSTPDYQYDINNPTEEVAIKGAVINIPATSSAGSERSYASSFGQVKEGMIVGGTDITSPRKLSNIKNLNIDGHSVLKYDFESTITKGLIGTNAEVTLSDSKVYNFEIIYSSKDFRDTFDQILSTFKFEPQVSVTSKNACEEAKTEISDLLDKANYCEKNGDCKTITLGCPFGCYNFVNKNSNSQNIQLAYSEYEKQQCSICKYFCIEPPTSNEIKCINKKCTNTRL